MKAIMVYRSQIQGLIWFCLVYAVARFALSMDSMANQSLSTFSIFFAAMTIAWLAYAGQKSFHHMGLLATNLLVVSTFLLLMFGPILTEGLRVSLPAYGIMIVSAIIFMIFLFKEVSDKIKLRPNHLWLILIYFLTTAAFVISFEIYL